MKPSTLCGMPCTAPFRHLKKDNVELKNMQNGAIKLRRVTIRKAERLGAWGGGEYNGKLPPTPPLLRSVVKTYPGKESVSAWRKP